MHAHWLPTAQAARLARVPYVVTLHGSDVALAQRAPRLARGILRAARGVIAVSTALADEARRLGAREVTVIPNGVSIPAEPGVEVVPPYVLFAGRLSRRRASRTSSKRRAACGRSSPATGRCVTWCRTRWDSSRARSTSGCSRAPRLWRALAARGVRPHVRGSDGVRAPGRRQRGGRTGRPRP